MQAAVLAHGIPEGQFFIDGNKRLALVAMLTLLEVRGVAMKRAALSLLLVLGAATVSATVAGAQPTGAGSAQATPKKQKVLIGFYKNRTVRYFDYGVIKLRPGNKVAPMWVFSNGADGQRSIVDSAPGAKQYSALHKVNTVTWKSDATPRVLRSAAAVKSAQADGELTITSTSRVVNAALLGFGQTRHAGFAKGKTIHYYELGVVKVAPGNEVLPIWTFTNGVDDLRVGERGAAARATRGPGGPPEWESERKAA